MSGISGNEIVVVYKTRMAVKYFKAFAMIYGIVIVISLLIYYSLCKFMNSLYDLFNAPCDACFFQHQQKQQQQPKGNNIALEGERKSQSSIKITFY